MREFGYPQHPKGIDHHRLIVIGEAQPLPVSTINWLHEVGAQPGDQRRPVFTTNNLYGMHLAVQSGLGQPNFPDYMVASEFDLLRVLPEISHSSTRCYFVYPEKMRHFKRIEVFHEFCFVKWLKRRSDLYRRSNMQRQRLSHAQVAYPKCLIKGDEPLQAAPF